MVAATQTKFVIVTPGRVAFTTPAAKEQFTSQPKQVLWTKYLQELLDDHGDIQIVESPAKLLADQQAKAAAAKPAPKKQETPRSARPSNPPASGDSAA